MINKITRRCLGLAGGVYVRIMAVIRRVLRTGPSALKLGRGTFDGEWYLEQNPDVSGFKGHIANHFFRHGLHEGRKARFFDSAWYFRAHDDLWASSSGGWNHYRKYGREEGRAARFIYVESKVERAQQRSYTDWLNIFEKHRWQDVRAVEHLLKMAPAQTGFALAVIADSHTTGEAFAAMLQALKAQVYDRMTVIIGLMPDAAPEIRDIAQAILSDGRFRLHDLPADLSEGAALNMLIRLTDSGYVGGLRVRDRLDETALYWMNEAAGVDATVLYADEDRLEPTGKRIDPAFKPSFNYELFLTHNWLGDFTLYRRDLFDRLNGYAEDLTDGQDYDLAFRAFETAGDTGFVRVPRMLNHVAAAPADRSQSDIVARHLERIGKTAEISPSVEAPGHNRIRYALPQSLPLVSIVIPTRDRVELMRMCLTSVFEKTTYGNYEIIIVDNGSVEKRTQDYFDTLPADRVRIIRDDQPFNYSALNNHAVREARGEFICMMNNDIEIITPDWLEELMSFAVQPETGCVGARLWYPDDQLQHAGVLIGFHGVAGHLHKTLKRGETGYADRAVLHQSLSAVTAALLVVRKSIYEQVGGFDEALAVAFNDVDFCLKVRNAGYRNVYTPYAEAYHHESASRGSETTPEKRQREQVEIDLIKARYGDSLLDDPAFNPNLSLTSEDIAYANPSRVKTPSLVLREARKALKDAT